MKTSHQSTKKCKYRTLEKYSNTYYENKQNINPAYKALENPNYITVYMKVYYLFTLCLFKVGRLFSKLAIPKYMFGGNKVQNLTQTLM
jgi:hypothetical protein